MIEQAGTRTVSVWIVDDDEAIRFVLERALSRAGYQTRSFNTVTAIGEALGTGQPSVIITDIRLPDADGLSVLQILQDNDWTVPVIAITAFSDLDQAVSAFQSGVFDYLSKPFDLDKVLSVVARASANSSAGQNLRWTSEFPLVCIISIRRSKWLRVCAYSEVIGLPLESFGLNIIPFEALEL